ncbi:uncharacterized protein LOC129855331 isoform X1 [Salvelinus fontinalis]|uniref:uncharacterized protein LOC129855331 isoform X1 n=1 Tax=Salvelinus fontinalis TaxID=8038 RepID=UPI0024852096|nr:uncharacterized protein LOC129855331 isoform X1 [Salvelinus fontinalis]
MDGEVHVETEMEYVTVRAHPLRRSWRLAVVLSVQNALVAVCLAVSFYCFWLEHQRVSERPEESEIYIHFDPITGGYPSPPSFPPLPVSAGIQDNEPIKFKSYVNHTMNLSGDSGIQVRCTGPYILYMEVCSEGLDGQLGNGTLELREGSRELASFSLQAREEDCRDSLLHQTVYLRKEEIATLHFTSKGKKNLVVKNLTLGLHYLLGTQCQH